MKRKELLRRTKGFSAYRAAHGRVQIVPNEKGAEPRSRTIQPRTWEQLNELKDASFDGSCIMDLGIGVFQKKKFT